MKKPYYKELPLFHICGERRSSGAIELSHGCGSERCEACDDDTEG